MARDVAPPRAAKQRSMVRFLRIYLFCFARTCHFNFLACSYHQFCVSFLKPGSRRTIPKMPRRSLWSHETIRARDTSSSFLLGYSPTYCTNHAQSQRHSATCSIFAEEDSNQVPGTGNVAACVAPSLEELEASENRRENFQRCAAKYERESWKTIACIRKSHQPP